MRDFYAAQDMYSTLLQVAVMTFALPVCMYLFLKFSGLLRSGIMVNNIKERLLPIFLNIVLIGILVFKILEYNPNIALKKFLLAYSSSYILMFFFTMIRQKWSLHMMSYCAMVPFLIMTSLGSYQTFIWQTALLSLGAGLVGTSRLVLQAHTSKEIVWGSILGVAPQLALYLLPLLSRYL